MRIGMATGGKQITNTSVNELWILFQEPLDKHGGTLTQSKRFVYLLKRSLTGCTDKERPLFTSLKALGRRLIIHMVSEESNIDPLPEF